MNTITSPSSLPAKASGGNWAPALAVGHDRLRHRAQRARGELGGLAEVGHYRVATAVDAAQAVLVAGMPGRVGVQQIAERGEGGVRERLEEGADNIGVG